MNLLIWKLSTWIHWSENPPHENINMKTFHMNILIWKPSARKYQPGNFPHEYLDLKTLHENINLKIFHMNISGWSPARASVKILGIHSATRHLVNSWKFLEMQMKTEYNMVSLWAVIWVPKCHKCFFCQTRRYLSQSSVYDKQYNEPYKFGKKWPEELRRYAPTKV